MNPTQHAAPQPPAAAPAEQRPTIVVGVDGSGSSRQALLWAARQAGLTGARLRAVMSWHLPSTAYMMPLPDGLDMQKATAEELDRTLHETLGDNPGIPVTTVVVEGHPALVLLDAAKDADLLVVGSRGHGAFAGMLLGSVSEHCVTHAHCPVVVIRDGR
jgi:nucleotide-binding universal stress UspA family protein